LFDHSILENQIQALSRNFRHRFKNVQNHVYFEGLSRPWKSGKKIQGLSRTRKSPGCCQRMTTHVIYKMQPLSNLPTNNYRYHRKYKKSILLASPLKIIRRETTDETET